MGNDGISRRKFIAATGAIGAGAWAAPAILTFDRAFAAGSAQPGQSGACTGCGTPNACDGQPVCGPSGSGCFCTANVGAPGCTCTQSAPCSTLSLCAAGQPSCGPGLVCQQGCCDEPRCFPICA
jgi:hypothetical protein